MISKVAISGYRSLRDIVLPLGQLTVVTGANGTGKSNIYRALRLVADIADDRIIASLAKEGGFQSVQWAGPEHISRDMRAGRVPIQGTRRKGPIALKLGLTLDALSYSIEIGLGMSGGESLFGLDPAIKREAIWSGDKPTPSKLIATRTGPSAKTLSNEGGLHQARTDLSSYDSLLRHITGEAAPWQIAELRATLSQWQFYDHVRADADAPARRQHIGTRTARLSPDGHDLAAALQTIIEVGDHEALANAVDTAFPGARLEVQSVNGLFQLLMYQHGMLRPMEAAELSDGTLRFLILACALLTPRPPPLMVLNEPEASLNGALIPALASLITRASLDCQIIVVSHNRALVSTLINDEAELVELSKEFGETFAHVSDTPSWTWPKR